MYGVDTNGLVQRAINASNAYDNIAGYIAEANKAALVALNTTNRVNDVSNCHNITSYFATLQGLQTFKEKTRFSLNVSLTVSTELLTAYLVSSTIS